MSETLIILRREFLERVRTKSFLISTIVTPLFFAALFALPAIIGAGGGGERKVVVVDEAPTGVADAFTAALTRPPPAGVEADDDAYTYKVERVAGPLAGVRDRLNQRVLSEEIDAYVVLPADVASRSEVAYRARNVASFQVQGDIRRAASEAVQQVRLRQAGLQGGEVASLLKPVELAAARVTEAGEDAGSAESTLILAYITGFLLYMMVLIYGINVMRSVLEEKTNRIVEVIVSSMRATHLMMGKMLGVGAVALLQVSIWIGLGALAVGASDTLAARFGLPPGAFDAVKVSPWVLFATLGFFLLGFLLYAALFAAVGAAVNSEQEAQQYQTIVFLPLIASLMFIAPVVNEPLGSTATILGMIPFTAPVTMAMRMSAAPIPVSQVLLSLAILALGVLFVSWLAGKIYRVGILSTGKKPTFGELVRWVRAA